MKLPTLNVGMLGGGTVVNAIPREAWFTVDLRSLDSMTQDRLQSAVVSTVQRIADQEKVGFRMERQLGIDYSKARPQAERLNHPLVQTTVSVVNQFRKASTPEIRPQDAGSTISLLRSAWAFPLLRWARSSRVWHTDWKSHRKRAPSFRGSNH